MQVNTYQTGVRAQPRTEALKKSGSFPYTLFWIFLYGSLIGFMFETLFGIIVQGRFECRSSMLYGPFNIVYGFGALALYLSLYRFIQSSTPIIFLVGAVSGTAVELVCAWVQQTVFHATTWDYSALPLNIGGNICLLFTIFWGCLAVAWVRWIQPFLIGLIDRVPRRIRKPLTLFLLVFIVINIVLSAAAVTRWGARIEGIAPSGTVEILIDQVFPDAFMERIYTKMVFYP